MKSNKLYVIILTSLLIASIPLGILACGGTYTQVEKAYIENEIEFLSDVLREIRLYNPMFRDIEFDSYLSRNTQNAPELLLLIEEAHEACDNAISYVEQPLVTPEELSTAEDLKALRDCIIQAANDMKELLALIKYDIDQLTYSFDAVDKMSNSFMNTYPYYFNQEAYRIAEEYGLQIDI